MSSNAVLIRLNVVIALLAGILGALLVVIHRFANVEGLFAAFVVGTGLVWLALEAVSELTKRSSA